MRISFSFSSILLALLTLKFSFHTCRLLYYLLVSLYNVINRFYIFFVVQLDIFVFNDENFFIDIFVFYDEFFFIDIINNYDDNVFFLVARNEFSFVVKLSFSMNVSRCFRQFFSQII